MKSIIKISPLKFCVAVVFLSLAITLPALSAPQNFDQAKVESRRYVYHDRTEAGTFYCGCPWAWTGKSGGRVDLDICGYKVRSQEVRAQRIEWEHIVPASSFGMQRLCWQQGGRKNCNTTDPVFNLMEADMHNLTPSVGEVNADRSNYRFGMLPGVKTQHGACDFRVSFSDRVAEPRDEIKGLIARVYFYMHDRYNLSMSRQQQQLFMAWHRQFPVSDWERERDKRIATRMGHHNPFVTGERTWSLGHKNSGEGLKSELPVTHPVRQPVIQQSALPIIGNKNSNVYHLPVGCPSYDKVAPHNQVHFKSEAEAQQRGFRKAGNCR